MKNLFKKLENQNLRNLLLPKLHILPLSQICLLMPFIYLFLIFFFRRLPIVSIVCATCNTRLLRFAAHKCRRHLLIKVA